MKQVPAVGAQEAHSFIFRHIRKRSGETVPFVFHKITDAIHNAGRATGELGHHEARRLTIRVLSLAQSAVAQPVPEVEEIQDLVEEVLLASPYKKTAKAYILYREQHALLRKIAQGTGVGMIDQYLEKLDWKIEENSNMNYSLQGLNHYISSEVSKTYWLNVIYPGEVRTAHEVGDLHLHDLGLLSTYCVGWDLQDLLLCGFRGVQGKAVSRPARHLRSALGQIVNFFYTLQGEAAGAQAFSNFDTLLAPFVRQDGFDERGVKQALQEFIFNLNVPTRVGFQTPFTNLTMDLQPPSTLADQQVIIGGERRNERYGDFQKEMTMINRAFLEVMTEGDAQGRVFTFPIPTYNIGPDFAWENEDLKPLWQATAKYGIPYFANFVNSDLSPEDARSMCCRLRLDTRELEKRGGGLFGANPLTGSIGVVTINLAAIGCQTKSEPEFFARLDHLMDLAKTSLEIKRKVLENFTVKGLYPYTRYYLRSVYERFGSYWSNHFSTIGIIGGNEAALNLLGTDIGMPPAAPLPAESSITCVNGCSTTSSRPAISITSRPPPPKVPVTALPASIVSVLPICVANSSMKPTGRRSIPIRPSCRSTTVRTSSRYWTCKIPCSRNTPAAPCCTSFSAKRYRTRRRSRRSYAPPVSSIAYHISPSHRLFPSAANMGISPESRRSARSAAARPRFTPGWSVTCVR